MTDDTRPAGERRADAPGTCGKLIDGPGGVIPCDRFPGHGDPCTRRVAASGERPRDDRAEGTSDA